MDLAIFNVNKKNIADVITEQNFLLGDAAEISVTVQLLETDNGYELTSWLNGCEELNTVEYEGSIADYEEILSAMEELVSSNEEYILDIASWDGE